MNTHMVFMLLCIFIWLRDVDIYNTYLKRAQKPQIRLYAFFIVYIKNHYRKIIIHSAHS